MQEQQYRCIHAACARSFPRPVNFCPWCGTGQHAGVDNPAHAPRAPSPSPSPVPAAPVFHPQAAPAAPGAPAAPSATPSAATAGSGPAKKPARPARRPVRLRWWLGLLAIVLGLWVLDKPRKLDAQVDEAIALGAECKLREAQDGLIALRKDGASDAQLQRLQQSLNDASVKCERKDQRARAWRDTVTAISALLDKSGFTRAQQRLQAFARKWGEDSDTRRMEGEIAALRTEWQQSNAARAEQEKRLCAEKGGKWLENSCW